MDDSMASRFRVRNSFTDFLQDLCDGRFDSVLNVQPLKVSLASKGCLESGEHGNTFYHDFKTNLMERNAVKAIVMSEFFVVCHFSRARKM